MPLYEYRCRSCDERFEVRRTMDDANAPASCSHGHADSVRLLSTFASLTTSSGPAPAPVGGGGGCCGGACGCGH